jgi:hypothetical protein
MPFLNVRGLVECRGEHHHPLCITLSCLVTGVMHASALRESPANEDVSRGKSTYRRAGPFDRAGL